MLFSARLSLVGAKQLIEHRPTGAARNGERFFTEHMKSFILKRKPAAVAILGLFLIWCGLIPKFGFSNLLIATGALMVCVSAIVSYPFDDIEVKSEERKDKI